MPRDILVTSALPYANGSIHLGHLVEYIQTDIWVRFQRLRGNRCLYLCASDAHGTPVMLKAEAEGVPPETLVARVAEQQQQDFADFQIEFDNFHSTHSSENQELTYSIYNALKDAGHIHTRPVEQAYDPEKAMFLPDRYVRGTCPNCGTEDQYGDACENCGATYSPLELRDAVSVVSGVAPVRRESEHYFFNLGNFETFLREWVAERLEPALVRKLEEWFEAGLRDWDISRDAPYFGFEIPNAPGKYFYVWLDAPVGYLASLLHLTQRRPELEFDRYWRSEETEVYHFIGKDIAYFHTLFWPAVLHGAGLRTPSGVFVHGFLTVNGKKMSKRRGTFIQARDYLEELKPDYLRYYYATKLGSGIEDIDLSLEDFVARTNSDLVGKVINIASRSAGFIHRLAGGTLAEELPEPELYEAAIGAGEEVAACFERREYGRAMRIVMGLADETNQYLDREKPWVLAKDPAQAERVVSITTQGLNQFRLLMLYLKPVLPAVVEAAEDFLGAGPLIWEDRSAPLLGSTIKQFQPLLQRIDPKAIDAILARTAVAPGPSTS